MHQLFVSYSSADRGWAEVLEQRLVPHLDVYRDKTRLTAAKPFQEQLFSALQKSSALLIVWSKRVRDMQGEWKEWVITERERFRALQPEAPIIYLLLDDDAPKVDAHVHKLDAVAGQESPDKVGEATWDQLIQAIKKVVLPHRIEVDCYVLACKAPEFATLRGDPNLQAVLEKLRLDFDHVARWYGDTREAWRPAGAQTVLDILGQLEVALTAVLKEDGVPELLKDNQVILKSGLSGLWEVLDQEAKKEIDRLVSLSFGWIFVDPLSLYHPKVQTAANRIAGCTGKNRWLNLFILDSVERIHDRSHLRSKLEADFASLYLPLVKPRFFGNLTSLGGVDVWHPDDFERVFRETVRLHGDARAPMQASQSPQRKLTTFGAGG